MKNHTRNTLTLKCALLAIAGSLSGCVQFTPVKDIAKDKPAYLAANFTIDSLPTSIKEKLPAAGSHPLPFKLLTITGVVSGHVGANNVSSEFKSTLVNAKDTGLVQQLHEVSSNGIPSAATFSLSYLNLFYLKSETTSYFQPVAPMPIVAHSVEKNPFDMSKPQEDTTFSATFTSGTAVQLVNFRVVVSTCHAAHYYPASRVTAGLQGDAIDLDCEDRIDNILQTTSRRTYLTEYGIYVMRTSATAAAKLEWKYSAFEKDGQHPQSGPGGAGHDKPA
ncbi:hypothetical protein [Paraburkholderia dinghuensis]|uniref:Lipoprotein n=1 Tax=Paraburkholderia dinghuensis TaxID=2305225 RepID=A0A3N6NLB7_9BURK|nr:hypothetical protein [Paraburkholderia dinghuensis]RQH09992.1 hypothetical protein D1Y85_02325 [Paraburkholderia dinghuensis]